MLLKMLVSMAGPTLTLKTGDLYPCDAVVAARLIAAGYAVAVPTETTMQAAAPETAMRPRPHGRKAR